MRIDEPLLSIIIPVYNVEKYISTCLDSILQQSFNNFELLLVDDGSNDHSGVICDEYAQKDKRVHVIHKENGGVSTARNVGINIARGGWLYFVDSDDELIPNCLELLMSNIREDVDVVEGRYLEIYNIKPVILSSFSGEVTIYSKSEYLYRIYRYEHKQYHGYLWNKIFRSSVIKKNNLLFHSDIYFKEDGLFIMEYVCNMTRNVLYFHDLLYLYYRRDTGMMKTYKKNVTAKSLTHLVAVNYMYDMILTQKPTSKLKCAAKNEICRSYLLFKGKIADKQLNKDLDSMLKKRVNFIYYLLYLLKWYPHYWKKQHLGFRLNKKYL